MENKLKQYFDDAKVSAETLKSFLSGDMQGMIDKLASSMGKIPAIELKGMNASQTRELNALVKAMNDVAIAQEKINTQAVVTLQKEEQLQRSRDKATAQTQRQAAATAKANTAYEQEKARIEQLRLAYMNLAFAKTKDETATKMALNEYNKAARGMQEVQNQMASTKSQVGGLAMQTSSLTMIMSELPNAGISARVFIMSLSNNILPLTMQFQQLANSVDNTGKRLGNIGALKLFGQSLLGLNAILMVAVSLFVAYSDEIMKLAENMWNGVDALNAAAKAQKAYNDEVENAESAGNKFKVNLDETKTALINTRDELNKALNTGGWSESNRALNLFKANLERLLPNKDIQFLDDKNISTIDKINKALQLTEDYEKKVAKAIYGRAAADKIGTEIAAKRAEIDKNRNDLVDDLYGSASQANIDKFYGLQISAQKVYAQEIDKWIATVNTESVTSMKSARSKIDNMTMLTKSEKEYLHFRIDNLKTEREIAALESGRAKLISESALAYENNTNKENKGRKAREKQLRDIYEKEIYYNGLIQALNEDNAKTQLIIAKERTDGEQNSFESRFAALARYTENVDMLNSLAKDKSMADENESFKVAKEKLDDNLKKKTISKKEYDTAYKIMESNHQKRIWTIQDEAYKAQNDNLRNSLQENLKIREDVVAEMNRLAEIQAGKNSFEFNQQAAQENINRIKESNDQILEVFADASVKKAGLDNDAFFANQELKKKELSEEVKLAKQKLQNAEENGVGIKEARDNWAAVYLKQGKELAKMEMEQELYLTQKKEDLKQQIIEKSLETIKALEQAYFQQRQEDLEDEYNHAKEINDEKIKDVEDREKAGVISKEEADKEKERLDAIALSQKKYLDEQTKELKRTQFLLDQGIALAEVAINTAIGATIYGSNPITAPLVPWIIGLGATQAALIAAQTIPAFEDGGEMEEDGNALVGEKRTEVGRNPDGTFFLTPDTPTIMPLKKGTKIYPSIAQSPLAGMDINALETAELNKAINIQVVSNNAYSDKLLMGISSELKENTKAIKNQRLIIPRKSMMEYLRGN